MPIEDDHHLNGIGRAQSVYQQPSTGEKHVLFYPTSPAPSSNSAEERRNCSSSSVTINSQARNNHKNSNINSEIRMKKTYASTTAPDNGRQNAASEPSTSHHTDVLPQRYNFKIGIYGWRKRCLYILILILLIMVIVNLALTLWVLKVMEFSSEGMGQLKIVSGGLRLEGKAFILDSLVASSIKSRSGQPIVVESSKNLTLSARNKNGFINNLIFLGNERFECLANSFKVMDDRGAVLFSTDKHEVLLGTENLRITGEGGTSFSGSIQTTLIRAESGHDLRLDSPTRSMDIHAPQGIHIESRSGKIKVISLQDVNLKSEVGAIHLESSSVVMPSLPTAIPVTKPTMDKNFNVFQLCVCENGKLFLAAPHSHCASSDEEDRICR